MSNANGSHIRSGLSMSEGVDNTSTFERHRLVTDSKGERIVQVIGIGIGYINRDASIFQYW